MCGLVTGALIAQAGLNLARIGSGPHLLPRRRALLIGIRSGTTRIQRSNTSQTDISTETLLGPHDDVNSLKKLLSDFGYEDPVVLMDDPDMGPSLQPTYANIMRELSRFLAGQKPGDKFFFGYAGHSSQKKNLDGTEKDGLDEFIIPSDASDFKNGDYSRVILDDVLKEKLVVPLLAGSQLVAVLDTCHSATLFDLEHDKCNRVGSWHSLVRRTVRRARETLHTLTDKAEPTLDSATPLRSSSKLSASSIKQNLKENIKFCSGYCCRPWTPAPICTPVLCISACKDSQLVWEADGESLTRTFVDVLTENPKPTLAHLMRVCNLKSRTTLRALRRAKHQGDEWNPQISSRAPLNMRAKLSL